MDKATLNKKFDMEKLLLSFFIIAVVGFATFIIALITCACVSQSSLHTITGTTPFSDFAETLAYATVPNPYTGDYGVRSIYPPLSIYIFYPFTWFCSGALHQYTSGTITLAQLSSNAGLLAAFFMYYLINMAIIMFVVAKMSKLKGKNLFYLLSIVFCFGPLLFCFIRANNTLTVLTLTLLFFWLNNCEKRWQRELSYLCLAGAATMKIYPIFMIFYLIWKEHRLEKLWSVLKTIGYALVLIFLPFVIVEGHFANCAVLIKNVTGFSGGGATQWGSNTSLETVIYYMTTGLSPKLSILHKILSPLLRYGLLGLAIILPAISFKSKKYEQFVILAIDTYLLWPGVSNGYCMSLMVIPLVLIIMNFNSYKLWEKFYYAILFGIMLCPIFYMYSFFLPCAIANIAVVVKAIVDIIRDDCKIFKEMREEKAGKTQEIKEEKVETESTIAEGEETDVAVEEIAEKGATQSGQETV